MQYIEKDKVNWIENHGDVLACRYFHTMYPDGEEAIGDCRANNVDNKKWDVFHIVAETENAYYGVPMLGLGLLNCMILKSDIRDFLEKELTYNVGMVGCHTGKPINSWKVNITPIVSKFKE